MDDCHIKRITFSPSRRTEDGGNERKRKKTAQWPLDIVNRVNSLELVASLLTRSGTDDNASWTSEMNLARQELERKRAGYKQQDILKRRYNAAIFLTTDDILRRMIECQLKCHYCQADMQVLYDVWREHRQWTVDRIDNRHGHNMDNYYLACLECNLRRRCQSDRIYYMEKHLKVIKLDGDEDENEDENENENDER